jgi:Zn-dependent M28 family amino/carboxypeptidase
MRLALVVVALLLGCSGERPVTPAAGVTPQMAAAASHIDAGTIRAVVAEIADDAYAGRAPGTEGDRMTRDYLSRRLASAGLEPGNAGAWQQTFTLVGVTASQPAAWTFDAGSAEPLQFDQHTDFVVASGVPAERASVTDAELVFVGYGIDAPEYQWDDYAGRSLEGKVLVMLNNDPHWDPALFEGEGRLWYGRWVYKYEMAAAKGAAGAIIIHTTESAGYPWSVIQSSFAGPRYELPAGGEPRLQFRAWMTHDAVARLVQAAGHELDELIQHARHREFVPVPLGITTSIAFENALTEVESGNVLGLLPGRDPALADELVVYTAHHDHLGVRPNDSDDHIYNGALDNASGTAMVVAIAEAFAALPEPARRSLLFAFVGAEEQGLLGSEYYVRHPTAAPGRIAANVNFDVGNNYGRTRDVIYIGLGKSTLDAVAQSVADHQGRILKPDQDPDKGFFYRSDQLNFARIGVPALLVRGGRDVIGHPGLGAEHAAAYIA